MKSQLLCSSSAPRSAALALLVLLVAVSACGPKQGTVPAGTANPDTFLFERGTESLNEKKWVSAREYFRQIVDGYPQSQHRADAKLGLGDTYLGEGTTEAVVLAANEFREFLTFYPTHPRADYAQYKLAMSHFRQMARAERDQTSTREAVREFNLFIERYPRSSLLEEVRARHREAQDRLSESDYRVGLFYYRARWYPGAIDRFKAVLKDDPKFTNRDAVYFYLAESLIKVNQQAEALPYLDRLIEEFTKSEFLEDAQKRLAQLKAAPDSRPPSQSD